MILYCEHVTQTSLTQSCSILKKILNFILDSVFQNV